MLTARHVTRLSHRINSIIVRRTILSSSFSADEAWAARHQEIKKLGLGGDYEWISAVQKKFIGGGVASAVDVDAAVCVAEQKDQVDDVVDLIYKLRHSENAADLPPSAEYALARLLLKHDPERLYLLAEDPINYGIFLNEHSACLAINHFVKRNDWAGAARLSAWVMQQEMTSCELLNLLCIYSTSKWAEQARDDQTMPLQQEEEEEDNEDDQKTFKFPYLKNDNFDSHFDLRDPAHLAGKTLLWMARDNKTLDQKTRDSVKFLGAVLYDRMQLAASLASSSILPAAALVVKERIEASIASAGEGSTPTENQQKILDALGTPATEDLLSDAVLVQLKSVQDSEEKNLIDAQTIEFTQWNTKRRQLIDAQAERVLLKIQLEELDAEFSQLASKEEKLSFFENRLQWEKRAQANQEIETPEESKAVATA